MSNAAQLALLSKLDATAFPPNTIFVFTCNATENLEKRFFEPVAGQIHFSSYGMAGEITRSIVCHLGTRDQRRRVAKLSTDRKGLMQ